MAAIPRKTQKIFAGDVAASGKVAQFGSLKAGTPNYSQDPDVIQALPAFGQGWQGAVMGTNSPALQDMNALFSLVTQQVAYVLQRGVPEWDSATEYASGCICSSSGTLYTSSQDANTGHAVSNTSWWTPTITVQTNGVPTGGMTMWAGSSAPSGWLLCNGTVYNIATYPALGVLLGSTYGGNGTTTFAVPDLRGRAPVGVGTGTATDATAWALAAKRGAETHSLTASENGPHTHGAPTVSKQVSAGGSSTACDPLSSGSTGSSGSGTAHNNLQPSLGVNFIIRA